MRALMREFFVLAFGLLGSCACAASEDDGGLEPWLPRTMLQYRCVFNDGSYVEYKEVSKWYPHAELIPHAQKYASWKEDTWYVDAQGRRHDIWISVDRQCRGLGLQDARIFYINGYQDQGRRFLILGTSQTRYGKAVPVPEVRIPDHPCAIRGQEPRLAELPEAKFLACNPAFLMRDAPDGRIVAESPVITLGKGSPWPYNTVRYVFRSIYDKGAWGPVELSTTGMIFEIGKTQAEQSWAPSYRCLNDRRMGGCK